MFELIFWSMTYGFGIVAVIATVIFGIGFAYWKYIQYLIRKSD